MSLEAKAENEQEQLLLLEPQEFLQGAVQLTQVLGKRPIFIWKALFPSPGWAGASVEDLEGTEGEMRKPAECSRCTSIEEPLGELRIVT